jgi:hypothetical protein
MWGRVSARRVHLPVPLDAPQSRFNMRALNETSSATMCCTSETQTIAKGIAILVQYEGFKAEIDKCSLKYLPNLARQTPWKGIF